MVHTKVSPSFSTFLSVVSHTPEPTSFKEAVQNSKWCQAMDTKLRALEQNNTWLVTDLPHGKKAIDCKWIYKVKYHPDGTIDRHKARLVILGCKQKCDIDYKDTFAPMAKMSTVRALLALAAIFRYDTCQMDVINTFLHGDLEEDVYMKFPQGCIGLSNSVQDTNSLLTPSTKVCKLQKSLYGLKQAPKQWFVKLSTTLVSFGYK